MWGYAARHIARALAVIALISQALMPGAMAAVSSRPGELPSVLCAMPADDMHSAHSAVGAELAELIAQKSQSAPVDTDHDCPACVIAQTATLPEPVVLKSPSEGIAAQTAPVFEVRFAHVPRGPPVGARAPPASLKA
ncbi:MAG: DUF2946 family protein [Hyphomonas sp.]